MKSINDILQEMDGGIMATPDNTMGMSNPMPPIDGAPGTEPITPIGKIAREKGVRKKKKRIIESLSNYIILALSNEVP